LLDEEGVALTSDALATLDRFDAAGQTALFVARNGRLLAALSARDRVRPEAAGLVDELRRLGIDPIILLTGDREAAARAVAADVPFSAIHAELLPEQKAELLAKLKSERSAVAMVGDGINDAPAL